LSTFGARLSFSEEWVQEMERVAGGGKTGTELEKENATLRQKIGCDTCARYPCDYGAVICEWRVGAGAAQVDERFRGDR